MRNAGAGVIVRRDRRLRAAVRRAALGQRVRAAGLAAPLIVLIFVSFFVPILALLTRAVYEPDHC